MGNKTNLKTYLVMAVILLGFGCTIAAADVIYVDDDGPADFNNIQAAIDAAANGDVVVLQPGTYTGTGNRDIDFLGKAITVRGATGDPNDCIIDCQGTKLEPHRGFKFVSGEDANSILEAITITNGYGPQEDLYGDGNLYSVGGALYCNESSPVIIKCVITSNSSIYYGGGICNFNKSNPTITYCTISNNSATYDGGGIDNSWWSGPTINNCNIRGNSSYRGAGIHNWGTSIIFEDSVPTYIAINNCIISNNTGGEYGGGISDGGFTDTNINNCLIIDNSSDHYGAGITVQAHSKTKISSCTVINNLAVSNGGGIHNILSSPGEISIRNSVIWYNQPSQIAESATVRYSDIQGGYAGVGNINIEPLFVDDYHISPASPCFDAGDPDYVAEANETDIDGDPRVVGCIDMGADEVYSSTSALLVIIPGILNFEAEGLPSSSQSQQISIKNYGTGVLNWQIQEPNDCDWLSVFPMSGQVNAGESNDVEITVNPNIAGYGTHSCQLQVTAADAENSPLVATVNLEVLGPQIVVNNDYFYFTAYGKSDDVAEQELIITNTGFDTLNWHIEIPDCNWLSVAPQSGQVTDGSSVVAISVDPTKVPAYGYNYATINIIDENASNSPQAVTVRLRVLGPSMYVNPYGLIIYAERNTKVERTFEIINLGYDILHWNIETPNDCNWLEIVEPLSGECAAEESDIVTVTVDANGLENNDYYTQLLIHSPECSSRTVYLKLIVYTSNEIHVPQDYPTIQEAVNAALTGDIIIVHPGKYAGFDVDKPVLTIRSIEPENPAVVAATIIESGGYVYGNYGDEAVINGLSFIYNPTVPDQSENGIYVSKSSDVQIKNCRVLNFPGAGICASGQYPSATIRDCVISNNGYIGVDAPGGINIGGYANIENCLITGNFGGGISVAGPSELGGCKIYIRNNTIADNFFDITKTSGRGITCGYYYYYPGLTLSLQNSITSNAVGPNDVEIFISAEDDPNNINLDVAYSNIRGGLAAVSTPIGANVVWGQGNIDADPCFVEPGYWVDANDPNIIVEPNDPNAVWVDGDYHLKSQGWRWDVQRKVWTWDDDVTSRCIDAGNPGSPLGEEPLSVPRDPNNDWGQNIRINMGAYGGTAEASMPPYDWALLADLTNDGTVNFEDYAAQAIDWPESESEQPGDLNRDGTVDIADIALLTEDWLKQTSWYRP